MAVFLKSLFISLSIVLCLFAVVFFLRQDIAPENIQQFFSKKITMHSPKTIHSNQWYSNLYNDLPSQPLYALPLAFVVKENGLGFSYPDVTHSEKTIAAPYVEDFTVGTDEPFTSHAIDQIADWSISVLLKNQKDERMQFTLGHGIPHTTITTSTKNLKITLPNEYNLFPNNQDTPFEGSVLDKNTVVLVTRNHTYLLAFTPGTTISINNNALITNADKVYVALLPNRNLYSAFLQQSQNEITSTYVNYSLHDSTIETTYEIRSTIGKPLIALYPHHTDFLKPQHTVLGTYDSLRGKLSLIQTDSFTTSLPLTIPNETFPKLLASSPELIEKIKKDTETVLSEKPPTSKGYYLGTYFGKVTSLIQLADTMELSLEKQRLIAHLRPLFLENLTYFIYDKEKTSIIEKESEFGNDKLNDHHFHYGYFIRTAAILVKEDPDLLPKIEPMVSQLVEDIATYDRSSDTYPFLRNFDIYEGHSWADGFAEFADGNNQESSSEAMNAWYAVYLWSQIIEDKKLEETALYLFNTELLSIKYYWFDITNMYASPYKHAIASIVWGGKVDFATWFSNKTNNIYGIQLLPYTPASYYLSDIKPFTHYETDFLQSSGSYDASWGDLMLMWKSFSDPEYTQQYKNRTTSFQEANPQSLYYYFLQYNSQ